MDSILQSIKKLLGVPEDYDHFDPDIIMYINSAFMILTQLGVGPKGGFLIYDGDATWDEFIGDSINFESVKTYVYLRVRLLFDPPSSSYVLDACNKSIAELEWRLNFNAEAKE